MDNFAEMGARIGVPVIARSLALSHNAALGTWSTLTRISW
jgi:hypothetical protein